MINKQMFEYGSKSSVIRELFSYGLERKKIVGADKVYDFSIGNPSIPAPAMVKQVILELLEEPAEVLHGYSPAAGDPKVREALADSVNRKFGTRYRADNFYMTAGAAASLAISIQALTVPGDEFIVFAPFFPEYAVWVETAGAKLLVTPADTEHFQIHLEAFENLLTPRTKGVIINSPNNPSGVVYSEETIMKLSEILERKQKEYGTSIYLLADEPYREIVYDGLKVPFIPNYYKNTLVCYSYSKALSMPGERIGYVIVPDEGENAQEVMAAIAGAGRALGYVCAPVLFQRVAARCADVPSDISAYKRNRDLLYGGLTELGYECVRPQGAFYLFVRSPEPDAKAFSERAKQHDVLVVPSDSFGCTGYVRVSYCVSEKMIRDALPVFADIMKEY
ncbi:MAG: pyridoxal phosphate-dependent aminotransferase [Lachnospiraceae bacterium]|nr:pyridoxal phosphate-dependent aminotransferase [Lachnospiraceae bacterium]MCI9658701.1 pyridoxal phosphate-dependent aminotransferase [Lachnospiraceae bacterium]